MRNAMALEFSSGGLSALGTKARDCLERYARDPAPYTFFMV